MMNMMKLKVVTILLLNISYSATSFLTQHQQKRHSPASSFRISAVSRRPTTSLSNLASSIKSRLQSKNVTTDEYSQTTGSSSNDDMDNDGISKFRRLKDLMWVRETREDLTAAEFASTIDASVDEGRKKRKRAIDYGNLMAQLDRRLADMGCVAEAATEQDDKKNKKDSTTTVLEKPVEGEGMGYIVISQEQREELFDRLLHAKAMLMETMTQLNEMEGNGQEESSLLDGILSDMKIEIPEIKTEEFVPRLYVRDDGTVDWDGALQDREAFQQFGARVWARINGRDPENVSEEDVVESGAGGAPTGSYKNNAEASSSSSSAAPVTADIEDTAAIRREREELEILKADLAKMELEHTQLLTSALSAGQAVANINLALLEPGLRARIKESSAALEAKKEAVSFQTLMYDLERIYTYLSLEMGSTTAKGKVPLQDRLSVAEFGLLESQMESFHKQLLEGESVDADVLQVVLDQVTDFKRRLGIDYMVTGLTFNQENIKQWLGESFSKTKEGLAFYVKGCKLFWNDIVFCLALFGRAIQGYTLKPREVRYLRRTFKDVTLFIPFIVILLIPLSPVGHVLVFGAIQRVFPNFFPSCFTESRQNLLQLYESTEYSELSINEPLMERLSRILEALAYQLVNWIRRVFANIGKVTPPPNMKTSSSSTENGLSSQDQQQQEGETERQQ